MNTADFSQPNGFPLEADATLGFMQSAYADGIRALARAIGLSSAILTGLTIENGIASDGWILYQDEIYFFVGGTVDDAFYIDTDVVAKANQDGQNIDRYFTRRARFGSGAQQGNFTDLVRVSNLRDIGRAFVLIADSGVTGSDWLVLEGCILQQGGISAGTVVHKSNIIAVPEFVGDVSENSPKYLMPSGEWTATANANYLRFDPDTNRRNFGVKRKFGAVQGQIIFRKTSNINFQQFPNGIGVYEWDGFNIADGTNGTEDLSGQINGFTALQRV